MAKRKASQINLVPAQPAPAAADFALEQNYPNPFNPATSIPYTLERRAHIRLTVHDAAGRMLATLVDGMRDAGRHTVQFDAASFASGVYYYRLESNGVRMSRKMVLLR